MFLELRHNAGQKDLSNQTLDLQAAKIKENLHGKRSEVILFVLICIYNKGGTGKND